MDCFFCGRTMENREDASPPKVKYFYSCTEGACSYDYIVYSQIEESPKMGPCYRVEAIHRETKGTWDDKYIPCSVIDDPKEASVG